MMKKMLVLSGSPKKDGNTAKLVEWFVEGAKARGARVEVVSVASLGSKTNGCNSCRACQQADAYACVMDDEVKSVLLKMIDVDVIVMATPMYFFGPSAQLKIVFDRMFCLFKWDNDAGTMRTPLKGKTFVLIASAYEDTGLDALERPFVLTAAYSGMNFASLLVPHAGVSGDIKDRIGIREKAFALGERVA